MIIEPEFLNDRECAGLIHLIRNFAEKQPLLTGDKDYRTSSTCNLSRLSDRLVRCVERWIAEKLEVDPRCGEGLAGAWYLPGEGYRVHHDAFHHGTLEHEKFVRPSGNRTWSAMIYLNTVTEGGETLFPSLGVLIKPKAGELVAWMNLTKDFIPHAQFIHSAQPPDNQPKYIVTQWFRERALP
jgi:prolyl 4-hydroxylase